MAAVYVVPVPPHPRQRAAGRSPAPSARLAQPETASTAAAARATALAERGEESGEAAGAAAVAVVEALAVARSDASDGAPSSSEVLRSCHEGFPW